MLYQPGSADDRERERPRTRAAIRIVLCSRSSVKMAATRAAIRRIEKLALRTFSVEALATPSGIPSQPVGHAQILEGALTRAARSADRSRTVSEEYQLAIESGIAGDPVRGSGYVDLAYVVARGTDGAITVRRSAGVPVPDDLVELSRESEWRLTVGQLEHLRAPGSPPDDPHALWSAGKLSRVSLLTDAVEATLRAALGEP